METAEAIGPRTNFSAICLIAGTSIGAGILGLPVETAATGFGPSIMVYALCWFFMTCTGLIMVELIDGARQITNFTALAKESFGLLGAAATSGVYLLLFLSLMIVYVRGGGELVGSFLPATAPTWLGSTLFITVLSPIILRGSTAVGNANATLLIGMVIAFALFGWLCLPNVHGALLTRSNWGQVGLAFPIILTAFGFQGTVPTLLRQVGYDKAAARHAIIWGSVVAFAAYALWQALILGTIPYTGANGLQAALASDQTAIAPLQHNVGSPWVYQLGRTFGLCALASSFLGVGISLVDFVSDGLKQTAARQRWIISIVVVLIPYLFAIQDIAIFYRALRYGGGLGCLILLVLLPTTILWRKTTAASTNARPLLWSLAGFFSLGVGCEIIHLIRDIT